MHVISNAHPLLLISFDAAPGISPLPPRNSSGLDLFCYLYISSNLSTLRGLDELSKAVVIRLSYVCHTVFIAPVSLCVCVCKSKKARVLTLCGNNESERQNKLLIK